MRFARAELCIAACLTVVACKGRNAEKQATGTDARSVSSGRPVTIPWISDDWDAALASAKKGKKPIFVDLWAPWCHTCLSMKQVVMTDASLAPYLDRFVWLEVDTDKPKNAPVLDKLPVDIWPTFYVVSATDSGVAVDARHLEAASVAQLRDLLDQGEQAHQARMDKEGTLDPTSPQGMVQSGDEAVAADNLPAAETWYGRALAAAPADWPRAPATLVKQINARRKNGDLVGCADLGMTQFQRAALGMSAQLTLFAQTANQCADSLDEPRARLLRGRLGEALRKVVDASDSAMSADDQSDALRVLREMAIALKDNASARAYAIRQRDLLDRAVAQAKTAKERMTHNWPRAEVYVYLGEGEKILADLERSVAELPKEYDPPARLAWVHEQLGHHDKAMEFAQKALALAYGPRKGTILKLIADIYMGKGDLEGERKAREAVLDYYESLTGGHYDEQRIADAEKALADVGKTPTPSPAPPKPAPIKNEKNPGKKTN
jgi:thiol-disulfide isomerase/thioredoxin/tetratricopeptide (TPR) repeat protein